MNVRTAALSEFVDHISSKTCQTLAGDIVSSHGGLTGGLQKIVRDSEPMTI